MQGAVGYPESAGRPAQAAVGLLQRQIDRGVDGPVADLPQVRTPDEGAADGQLESIIAPVRIPIRGELGAIAFGNGAGRDGAGTDVTSGKAENEVTQFTDVPRVVATPEEFLYGRVEVRDGFVGPGAAQAQEVPGEGEDVRAAFPEGREMAAGGGDAVVEIEAEVSPAAGVAEVAVRGTDEAELGLLPGVAADSLVGAFLHGAQQFGLEGHGEFPHLVEEDGPLVSEGEGAITRGHGAGEGAAFVTEEFAAGEFRHDGGAVQYHERTPGHPGIKAVDEAGHEFLARAGLAGDQQGTVRETSHFHDLSQGLAPGGA